MQITALLTSFIYLVSSSLFLPVLLLLAFSTLWVVIHGGSFFSSLLRRKRRPLPQDPVGSLQQKSFSGFSDTVRAFIVKLETGGRDEGSRLLVYNLLRETEHELWKSLDPLKIMVRVGPGLGLIGTLIPMGTGLAGLSQGDFSRLSGDLVIAFTTTVVGMALGLSCYVFFTVQRRWIEEDLQYIELAAEVLCQPLLEERGENG